MMPIKSGAGLGHDSQIRIGWIMGQHATVDDVSLARNVARFFRSQKGYQRCDIMRLAELRGQDVLAHDFDNVSRHGSGGRRQHQTWRHRIAADTLVAMLRRQLPRQADDRGLRDVIRNPRNIAGKSTGRGRIDNTALTARNHVRQRIFAGRQIGPQID